MIVFLFLLGGTVAVALVPLYLRNRAVPASPSEFSLSLFEFEQLFIRLFFSATLSSKEVTMIVEIEKNHAFLGRRKRAPGDLTEFVGSEFGPTGRDMVSQKVCIQSLARC